MVQANGDDIPAIAAIKAAIDPRSELTASEIDELGQLLRACWINASAVGGDVHPQEMRGILTGLSNGYGCWLAVVEDAIKRAEINEVERAFMRGAFGMASSWLFDIFDRNRRTVLRLVGDE